MSEHYPKVRLCTAYGDILIRDGLDICFYMRRSHHEVAHAVMRSLEAYRRAIEPRTLDWYVTQEGDLDDLDEQGWKVIRHKLLETHWPIINLTDTPGGGPEYRFEYWGKWLEDPRTLKDPTRDPSALNYPDMVSAVSFWLPTEFLEAHGPARVRALALELAAILPFNSGHAGLSFNALTSLLYGPEEWRQLPFRYPGMDMIDLGSFSWYLGNWIRAPHWLTFLGPPVLGELGGVEGLRARLTSPSTTVQPLGEERAVVSLGTWPEAGDMEAGRTLPEYRELARVLDPWVYQRPYLQTNQVEEDLKRWRHRFLD
jgi:hypothetical protein